MQGFITPKILAAWACLSPRAAIRFGGESLGLL